MDEIVKILKATEERLREERRKQYEELRLFNRCSLIARKLGKPHPKKHGAWWIYEDHEIIISYDDYAPNLEVIDRRRQLKVLDVHLGDLKLFRPGKWLRRVLSISNKLLGELEKEERARRIRELEEEIKKWEAIE